MSDTRYNWERKFRHQLGLKSLAAFVLAALALSSLIGAWYRSVRSSNALDELYYATVDSTAYDAIAHGFTSPDVLLSSVLLVKDQDVRKMRGIDMVKCEHRYPEVRNGFLDGYQGPSLFGKISGMEYSLDNKASREAGATLVEWEATDGWGPDNPKRRYLSIYVGLPASAYGDETTKGKIIVFFRYSVDDKVLECYLRDVNCRWLKEPPYASGNIWFVLPGEQGPSEPEVSNIDYIKQHHIQAEKAAEDALTVIEGTLLPNFVNRGGSTSTHSADIEADGVTVDIDLSQLDQPKSE